MPVLSYVHQRFNADQCHAYIHPLRWKDRPLQCPRCQRHHVGPGGASHSQPGLQRYRCQEKDGKRPFNALTGTLWDGSKHSVMHGILAALLLCLSCSSRRIARELGVDGRTSYRWSWWLRHTALSYETDRQLAGTVEADDLYHTAGNKGQAQGGGKKALGRCARGRRKKREPGRGHYDKDRPAMIAWVSRQGAVVIQATRDCTVQTVQKAADLAMPAGRRLYPDSASSYRALKGYGHDDVHHTQKEYARGDVHENRAECLFSLLKPYLRVLQCLRNVRQQNTFEQAGLILRAALAPTIARKARKGEFVKYLDHLVVYTTAADNSLSTRTRYNALRKRNKKVSVYACLELLGVQDTRRREVARSSKR